MQNFRSLGTTPPDPRASGGWGLSPNPPVSGSWGLRPQTPQTAPSIANFWLRAWLQNLNLVSDLKCPNGAY